MNMQIIQHYIGLAVFLALLAGFPVMIIYAVVLYFRGRKIPKSPNEMEEVEQYAVNWEEEWWEEHERDVMIDPAYRGLPCNIHHKNK